MEDRALTQVVFIFPDGLPIQRLAGGGMEQPGADASVIGQALAGQQLVQVEGIAQGVVSKSSAQPFHLFGDLLLAGDNQFAILDGLLDRIEAVGF